MHPQLFAELGDARYALLRTYRRDGTPVDTPVWFAIDDATVVFRTKIGPKTRRMTARPEIELTACDYRGRRLPRATALPGRASVLSGDEAEAANRTLHRRYGWQWNVVPMVPVPGVTNVHRDLPLRDKLRRTRTRSLWPDSVIVRIDPLAR
ncbi:PPOX class F420-dependent oxidoreductase [[Mycobacterium] holstebronense]|uniref:PPOX class F420-dependent oxidoreductase n=1 Tax=[Mycobacterium] holstebronense TaxID=3064288 RepID=A0ABN9NDE2_9MYCO|nr:PPOX class F420-dependent oxidoreductase [Mycolicibacter sp. MU0102]CAJ1504474.1 PPOX class F420-dependent oxidoreductase [Mycolicibacter sp. MU0102]